MGERTAARPVASGRVAAPRALEFGVALMAVSFALLATTVNVLTAALALLGGLFYVVVYTGYLKRSTDQNIVIGGIAGAIPPLVGAAAASGHLGWSSWWLFSLVMVWTPAHFWALALLLHDDYRSVGIPMLPVVKGLGATAQAIGRYSWLTAAMSLAGVFALPSGGWLYGLLVLPFNARLLQLSASLRQDPQDPRRARSLFRWSIFYLFGICLLLVLARTPLAASFDPAGLLAAVVHLAPAGAA
jgi:protoheme IX farnesyltransferase